MSLKVKITHSLSRYFPPKKTIDPRTITDDVFCIIEKNSILLDIYKRSWGGEKANNMIAKIIKEHYVLANEVDAHGQEVKNNNPNSILIDSYQVFKW